MRKNISLDDDLLKKVDEYCENNNYGLSELIAELLRHRIMGVDIVDMVKGATEVTKGTPIEGFEQLGYVKNPPDKEAVKPVPPQSIANIYERPEPEYLWDDYNLMPVYKTGEDDQFCTTFHKKGLKQRVYPVKKFDVDSKLLWERQLCRECIKSELSTCRSGGGHLE